MVSIEQMTGLSVNRKQKEITIKWCDRLQEGERDPGATRRTAKTGPGADPKNVRDMEGPRSASSMAVTTGRPRATGSVKLAGKQGTATKSRRL